MGWTRGGSGGGTALFIFFTCTAGMSVTRPPGGWTVVGFASLDLSPILGEAKNTMDTGLGVRKEEIT